MYRNDKVDIEIYSITGKKLKSITNYNLDKNISLLFLQKGVYLIKILNNRTSETIKIIRK